MPGKDLLLSDRDLRFPPGMIIDTGPAATISLDELIESIASAPVIYVGESHTSDDHHGFQLKIIQRLQARGRPLVVAMEMFDRTYQSVLDEWSRGQLTEESFLERSHWYANWKYRFSLYRPILEYLREEKIRLIGLNIPFHIPRKVRIGGLDSLTPVDQKLLPESIDTTIAAHRSYLEETFKRHSFHAKANFEFFYEAQCLWEDTMAETAARHLEDGVQMVVLAGNGHIRHHYGVPDRMARRSGKAFKTIYQALPGESAESAFADYIRIGQNETETVR